MHYRLSHIILILLLLPLPLWVKGDNGETTAFKERIRAAWALKATQPDSTLLYTLKILEDARAQDNPAIQSSALYVLAAVNYQKGDLNLALNYALEGKEICSAIRYHKGLTNAYDLIGTITMRMGDHAAALKHYLEELALIQQEDSLSGFKGTALLNTGTAFEEMGFADRALIFYNSAEPLIDDEYQSNVLMANKASVLQMLSEWEAALSLSKQAYAYFASIPDSAMMAKCLHNQGLVALNQQLYQKAQQTFQEALPLCTNLNQQVYILVNLSKAFEQNRQSEQAYTTAREAFTLSQTLKDPIARQLSNSRMQEYFLAQGKLDSSLTYMVRSRADYQQLLTRQWQPMLDFVETELQAIQNVRTQVQELDTARVQLMDSEGQKKWMQTGIAVLALLLVVGIGLFVQFRRRKDAELALISEKEKNQVQLLQGMIKEQELNAISHIIEGQEQEKKRVSEELHDGLGGTLAAIRISLQQFRRQLESAGTIDLTDFEYATGLLREATDDVRRISHDMGAVRLKHGGLVTALEDMCRNLSRHQAFVAKLETEGLEVLRINSEVEFHLYRIAQELFQNIIKHAQAQNVKIQLANAGGRLHLYMWDDGQGFDAEKVRHGMGLENLHIRTRQINGKIHIDSTPGKGTYTHISIPV